MSKALPSSILDYSGPVSVSENMEELSRREREVLLQVNQKVAGAGSLGELLELVFRSTREICPCDRLGLAFVEDDGARIRAEQAVADYEPLLLRPGYAEDLARSSLSKVIEEGTPRIINDLEAYLEARPRSHSTDIIVREGVRSSLTCPLSVDGRNVGVLFRSSRRRNAYDAHQVRLHMAVAERLGQAVEKAYRIKQLEAATQGYFEMLGFVSHELKSPVASVVTDAELLRGGYLGDLEADQLRKINGIIRKGHHLLGLVREYLDLSRIEGGGMEPRFRRIEDVARELIEPSIELIASDAEARGMRIERDYPEEPAGIEGDPDLLRIVLVNLLGNAVKYGDEGGEVRIGVRADEGETALAVRNDGPGFPESSRPALFKKFSRLDTPALRRRKGTGVGLYTSWRIVRMHGGRITAESEEGSWAEFTVFLPR